MEEDEFVGVVSMHDPMRETRRRTSRDALVEEMRAYGVPENLLSTAVDEYESISGDRIYQKERRVGLQFACILYAYKAAGCSIDLKKLARTMGIEDKVASRGIQLYDKLLLERHGDAYETSLECSPEEYVDLLLQKLSSSNVVRGRMREDEVRKVTHIVLQYLLSSRSGAKVVRSSTPRCVAAGVVHFHLEATGILFDKKGFVELCECSQASVDKLHRDVAQALVRKREEVCA